MVKARTSKKGRINWRAEHISGIIIERDMIMSADEESCGILLSYADLLPDLWYLLQPLLEKVYTGRGKPATEAIIVVPIILTCPELETTYSLSILVHSLDH